MLNLRAAALLVLLLASSAVQASPCVILLHGLARTSGSMQKMAEALQQNGYRAVNIDYPSRSATIAELADEAIPRALQACAVQQDTSVHFVTHSMGGILVRQYLSVHSIENLGRVVMLAPPNKGSEIVDELRSFPGYELLNGPAGQQLGAASDSIPNSLGPVDFDLGVLAGTQSLNPLLSQLLPDPDDGKVSVESTKIEGMCAFLALPVTHTFIMRSEQVISQVLGYLQHGRFDHADARQFPCRSGG